jgi:hypothetical protein
MRLVSCSALVRDRVSSSPPCCSLGTHSPLQDMYRENSGEVLPKFCLGSERSMKTNLIYASAGEIRTYPHLLESRNDVQMQFLVMLLPYIYICQRMENRDWMYTGHEQLTPEWLTKTNAFLEHSFGEATKGSSRMPCPCFKCDNRVRKNKKHVGGYYQVWIHTKLHLLDPSW